MRKPPRSDARRAGSLRRDIAAVAAGILLIGGTAACAHLNEAVPHGDGYFRVVTVAADTTIGEIERENERTLTLRTDGGERTFDYEQIAELSEHDGWSNHMAWGLGAGLVVGGGIRYLTARKFQYEEPSINEQLALCVTVVLCPLAMMGPEERRETTTTGWIGLAASILAGGYVGLRMTHSEWRRHPVEVGRNQRRESTLNRALAPPTASFLLAPTPDGRIAAGISLRPGR